MFDKQTNISCLDSDEICNGAPLKRDLSKKKTISKIKQEFKIYAYTLFIKTKGKENIHTDCVNFFCRNG